MIIVPHIQYLVKDSVPMVRAGAANIIGSLTGILQKDLSTAKLLPHILEMFGDEHKDVREGTNRAAARFCEAIGPEVLTQFLPFFKKSIEDLKWRVRLEGYQAMVSIALKYQNP